ncbi:chemotaxis protein CheW [Thermodesulfobacteriota bacterium]
MGEALPDSKTTGMDNLAGKYLTFVLGKEHYGINILKVREIIGLMEITAVPHTPQYLKGVINLRGRVIPVVDLRMKFHMNSQEYTDRTCIIVVEVQDQTGVIQIGMVVDSVSEVLNVAGADVEPPPSFGKQITGMQNILGMAKANDSVTSLLDIDRIVDVGDVHDFQKN